MFQRDLNMLRPLSVLSSSSSSSSPFPSSEFGHLNIPLPLPPPAKCIDRYIAQRVAHFEGSATEPIDSRLEEISRRMFDRCFEDKEFKQVFCPFSMKNDQITQGRAKYDEKQCLGHRNRPRIKGSRYSKEGFGSLRKSIRNAQICI